MFKTHAILFMLLLAINTYSQENSFESKSISIRSNIPTWILGVPSIGISYKINNQFEVILDGALSPWKYTRNGAPFYWSNWNISPQIRTYLNEDKSTYFGLQYSKGMSILSRQLGEYQGGGLSIGKQYYAGKKLLIDLGITFGYLRMTDQMSYTYRNNTYYVNRKKEDSNYWGPTALSIRLSRKVN